MGGRAVEGTGLENRQARERLVGSNPTPSAINLKRSKINREEHAEAPEHFMPGSMGHRGGVKSSIVLEKFSNQDIEDGRNLLKCNPTLPILNSSESRKRLFGDDDVNLARHGHGSWESDFDQ